MAWTVPSAWKAKTSATPVVLGTAGTINVTPEPSPGLDQITVPRGSVAAETVTSAAAVPAVMVTFPTASAVSSGGSSVERLTMVGSVVAQVSPVTVCPEALSAWRVRVSPTTMLSRAGTSALPLPAGTVKPTALLQTPFCWIFATPVSAAGATVATTCVSVHDCIELAAVLPSQATPGDAPKPLPVNVTEVPAAPDVGLTLATWSASTVNGIALLMTPFCKTWALPENEPAATVATIWVSLQLCTTPLAVLSHTWPLPCVAPKPEPATVTWVIPCVPVVGETVEMVAVLTVKGTLLDQYPFCCTRALPDLALEATVARICVSLQVTTVPVVLPSSRVPLPCTVPKFEPEIVTGVPATPDVGETLAREGTGITVKTTGLLGAPYIATTTLPVVAPLGTFTVMLVSAQLLAVPAAVPLNVTVQIVWFQPNPLPVMVTCVPTGPDAG